MTSASGPVQGGGEAGFIAGMASLAKEEKQELTAAVIASANDASSEAAKDIPPSKQPEKQKKVETPKARLQKAQKADKSKDIGAIAKLSKDAAQHQQKYPELNRDSLVLLRRRIQSAESKEEMLEMINSYYPDPLLADQALEFLEATSRGDKDLHRMVVDAQDLLKNTRGREIDAGRNIKALAQEAAEKGLGKPTDMRLMYYDLTIKSPDAKTLFDELSQKYNRKELDKVAEFLFHSLGADLKAGGSDIDPGKLHNLMTEIRALQAVKGVFLFMDRRWDAVHKELISKAGYKEG